MKLNGFSSSGAAMKYPGYKSLFTLFFIIILSKVVENASAYKYTNDLNKISSSPVPFSDSRIFNIKQQTEVHLPSQELVIENNERVQQGLRHTTPKGARSTLRRNQLSKRTLEKESKNNEEEDDVPSNSIDDETVDDFVIPEPVENDISPDVEMNDTDTVVEDQGEGNNVEPDSIPTITLSPSTLLNEDDKNDRETDVPPSNTNSNGEDLVTQEGSTQNETTTSSNVSDRNKNNSTSEVSSAALEQDKQGMHGAGIFFLLLLVLCICFVVSMFVLKRYRPDKFDKLSKSTKKNGAKMIKKSFHGGSKAVEVVKVNVIKSKDKAAQAMKAMKEEHERNKKEQQKQRGIVELSDNIEENEMAKESFDNCDPYNRNDLYLSQNSDIKQSMLHHLQRNYDNKSNTSKASFPDHTMLSGVHDYAFELTMDDIQNNTGDMNLDETYGDDSESYGKNKSNTLYDDPSLQGHEVSLESSLYNFSIQNHDKSIQLHKDDNAAAAALENEVFDSQNETNVFRHLRKNKKVSQQINRVVKTDASTKNNHNNQAVPYDGKIHKDVKLNFDSVSPIPKNNNTTTKQIGPLKNVLTRMSARAVTYSKQMVDGGGLEQKFPKTPNKKERHQQQRGRQQQQQIFTPDTLPSDDEIYLRDAMDRSHSLDEGDEYNTRSFEEKVTMDEEISSTIPIPTTKYSKEIVHILVDDGSYISTNDDDDDNDDDIESDAGVIQLENDYYQKHPSPSFMKNESDPNRRLYSAACDTVTL